jgi:hypothetical protein
VAFLGRGARVIERDCHARRVAARDLDPFVLVREALAGDVPEHICAALRAIGASRCSGAVDASPVMVFTEETDTWSVDALPCHLSVTRLTVWRLSPVARGRLLNDFEPAPVIDHL